MGRACPPQLCLKRSSPSWLKVTAPDVEENICKFARKGMTPSQIGVILRDSHGIAQVKSVTGSKILRVLKAHEIQRRHQRWEIALPSQLRQGVFSRNAKLYLSKPHSSLRLHYPAGHLVMGSQVEASI
ncbi:hypothetical protein CerSpe_063200 [Prunus speciosa]